MGLDIGFHLGDNRKQKYLQKHFVPYLRALNNLKFIILHGCYKENKSQKSEETKIDLFDDTLNALHQIIYIDLSCFCDKLKSNESDDEKEENEFDHFITFPTSVQCINFSYSFEMMRDQRIKVCNILKLKQLKLIYIELNAKKKKCPIHFISQFLQCPSVQTVAINLAGLIWNGFKVEQKNHIQQIAKVWKINDKNERMQRLNVVVITTQNGVDLSFKNIMNECFGDNEMVNVQYLDSMSGLKWLFEYVSNNIGCNDAVFKKLWRVYHFSRSNFSSLDVNMHQ